MAVVDSYYTPKVAAAPNAFVTFWSSFLGERAEMNKAILAQHLKKMDPTELQKLEASLREKIGALQEERSKMIRGEMKGVSDVMTNVASGVLQYAAMTEAARIESAAKVTSAKIGALTETTKGKADQRNVARENSTLTPVQLDHLGAVAGEIGNNGLTPEAAYQSRLNAAMGSAANGQQRDTVALRFYQHAVANGHNDVAATIAAQYFPGAGSSGRTVEEVYDANWGATGTADYDDLNTWIMQQGGGGGGGGAGFTDAMQAMALLTGGAYAGGYGGAGPSGQGSAGAGSGTVPAPGTPGYAAPTDTTTRGPAAPAAPQQNPDPFLFGYLHQRTNEGVAAIDQQIAGLERQINEVRARQQEGAATSNFGPFTGRNYLTSNLNTTTHRNQGLVDLVTQQPHQIPLQTTDAIEQSRRATGGLNLPGAVQQLQAEGGQQNTTTDYGAIPDNGTGLYAWIGQQLRMASAYPDTAPFILAELRRLHDRLPLAAIDEAPPGLWEQIQSGDGSSAATLAGLAEQQAQADDVTFAEMLGDQLDAITNETDPAKKLLKARMLGRWTASLPSTLTGTWGQVVERDIERRIGQRDARGLLFDLEQMRGAAYGAANNYAPKPSAGPGGETAAAAPQAEQQKAAELERLRVATQDMQHVSDYARLASMKEQIADLSGTEAAHVTAINAWNEAAADGVPGAEDNVLRLIDEWRQKWPDPTMSLEGLVDEKALRAKAAQKAKNKEAASLISGHPELLDLDNQIDLRVREAEKNAEARRQQLIENVRRAAANGALTPEQAQAWKDAAAQEAAAEERSINKLRDRRDMILAGIMPPETTVPSYTDLQSGGRPDTAQQVVDHNASLLADRDRVAANIAAEEQKGASANAATLANLRRELESIQNEIMDQELINAAY